MERLFARADVRYADPLSDRKIAEWVLSVPPGQITSEGRDKWVPQEAMRGLLPDGTRDGSFRANPGPIHEYGVLRGAESDAQPAHSR